MPDAIHQIAEVPRTLSNKKLEVPVKKILLGGDPERAASRDSLANPAALDWFVERAARAQSSASLSTVSSDWAARSGPTSASRRRISSAQKPSARSIASASTRAGT